MKEPHTWLLPLSTPFMFHFYSFTYISILLYFHFPMQFYPDLLHPLPIYCIPSLISCIPLILTRILIFPTWFFTFLSPFRPSFPAFPSFPTSFFRITTRIPFLIPDHSTHSVHSIPQSGFYRQPLSATETMSFIDFRKSNLCELWMPLKNSNMYYYNMYSLSKKLFSKISVL